ncbi:MAG: transglycosylase SLT domain-containing protein [Muribaculaceae bacterium]|nr:transglycosylase SLT domain-containing protein [Muribaculaceae bacterium]
MKKAFLFALMTASALGAYPKTDKSGNVLDLKHSITDNSIVYPESFEADTRRLQEGWFVKNYTATDNRYATEPDANVSDAEMVKRLAALPTVIEMPYNQIVRSYIDRYTKQGRAQVSGLLGLSLYYMPIFEQALEEQGLPLELKYLPVIESGLNPNAVSKHGAAGLWQFMLATAKGLGMEVNSLVDERRDPYVASERAASYLKDLYSAYGDWSLAIAAYNCGPGTVNKAIRRAGGDPKKHDFWSIYSYLPAETRGYVPMFIAANYVMNYYPQHNISPVLPVKPLVMDTLQIGERIHFNQISKVIDIPVEELRILNPQFRADIIPGTPDSPYTLILPSQQIHAYLMSENDIRNFEAEKYSQRGVVEPDETPADAIAAVEETQIWAEESAYEDSPSDASSGKAGKKSLVVHKVVAGETLTSIANKYGVSIADIKRTNNLRRNAVRVGQQLRISSSSPQAVMESTVAAVNGRNQAAPTRSQKSSASSRQTTSQKQTKQAKASAPASHNIKSGETLSSISKKYGVSIEELKRANGMKNDNLRAGESIKIPTKGSVSSSSKSSKSSKKATASKGSSKKSPAKSSGKKSSSKKRKR